MSKPIAGSEKDLALQVYEAVRIVRGYRDDLAENRGTTTATAAILFAVENLLVRVQDALDERDWVVAIRPEVL